MCHRIGRPPISTIGFGRMVVSSLRRVPNPPARITAFIRSPDRRDYCTIVFSLWAQTVANGATPGLSSWRLHSVRWLRMCRKIIFNHKANCTGNKVRNRCEWYHFSTLAQRMADTAAQIRRQILDLTTQYYSELSAPKDFIPGVTPVPVSGKVIDGADVSAVVDSALDAWFTTGRFAGVFERNLARLVGVRSASLVNSGSSANLVALSALTSPKLGDRRLKPGDEVITVAAGFPTTVNPIFQNRLVPVFLDVTLPTYEIDVSRLEEAYSPKVKAVMIAHTLGNVFNLDAVTAFVRKHNLWLIEDCCDALGSSYQGRKVGTFGDIATVSFYPAHHITMGEGGAVLTDKPA